MKMHNFQDTIFIYEHLCSLIFKYVLDAFNLFQPNVAFYKETSHLICRAKGMTGSYMKSHTGLKWVKCVPEFSLK